LRRRILEYLNRINRALAEGGPTTDWDTVLEEHLVQIGFFQHERLIHLIVTATFALVLMLLMNLLYTAASIDILLVVLFIFVTIFLLLYVGHYYILETSVQKMYIQYDQILQKKTGQIDLGTGQDEAFKA